MKRHKSFFASMLIPALVVAGLLVSSTAFAAVPRATPVSRAKMAGAGQGATHTTVQELRSIRSLLEHSDHDYKGHRVAAIHQITKAIHELEGHHKKPGQTAQPGQTAKKNSTQGGGGKEPLPQAQSDANLKKAIGELHKVLTALGTSHPKVHIHLKEAIKDLHEALKAA